MSRLHWYDHLADTGFSDSEETVELIFDRELDEVRFVLMLDTVSLEAAEPGEVVREVVRPEHLRQDPDERMDEPGPIELELVPVGSSALDEARVLTVYPDPEAWTEWESDRYTVHRARVTAWTLTKDSGREST